MKSQLLTPSPADAVITRADNLRKILDILETETCVTRAQLIETSGLGAMTVYRAVRRLEMQGFLRHEQQSDARSGRMQNVFIPSSGIPILVMDASAHMLSARLVGDDDFYISGEQVPLSVSIDAKKDFSMEENLRLMLAQVRRVFFPLLLSGQTGGRIYPILVLPYTEGKHSIQLTSTFIGHLSDTVVEELSCRGVSVCVPKHPLRPDTFSGGCLVTDARTAALRTGAWQPQLAPVIRGAAMLARRRLWEDGMQGEQVENL